MKMTIFSIIMSIIKAIIINNVIMTRNEIIHVRTLITILVTSFRNN